MSFAGFAALAPWRDPEVTAIRRLPMRSWTTPDPARTVPLDGSWQFRLYDSPTALPDDVAAAGLDLADWRTIQVPGEWTLQDTGDLPHYTNVQMPFAGLPPEPPAKNPTGVYRTTFTVPRRWGAGQLVLQIGAADSVHAVFVNGRFAGYGTDNQLASEYDVTELTRRRERNELTIVVIRYSAQSFVEDQDRWWQAGLHRSVTLEHRAPVHVHEVHIAAGLAGDPNDAVGSLAISTTVAFANEEVIGPGWLVRAQLERLDGRPVGRPHTAPVPVDLAPNVFHGHVAELAWTQARIAPWTAETPNRYAVRVTLVDPAGSDTDESVITTGFRTVEIVDRELRVNGRRIMIQGVNRHDHHPDHGRALSVEEMRADLVAMKRANVNAVRTAHYPNDPHFLGLCDELGLYVVAEANIESHAFNTSLCDDPRYRATWLARGERMVRRDRNHPCAIFWSLGNESGYGASHDALAGLIRSLDPTRPLHYEGAVLHAGWESGGLGVTDVVCPMYPELSAIERYARSNSAQRPLILCEYSHAMGNSNGSLADHWELFGRYPLLQGGFVWEWKDHALRQLLADGRTRLAYGGQFGDMPNDGNFVADGLVGADLDPHPALAELAWCHRPVAISGSLDGLVVSNRQSFRVLAGLSTEWQLLVDGEVVRKGRLHVPAVAPGTTATLPFPVAVPAGDGEATLLLRTTTRHDEAWADRGHLVAVDEVVIRKPKRGRNTARVRAAGLPAVSEVLEALPTLNLRRAPTDNDGYKVVNKNIGVGGHARARWIEAGVLDRPAEELVDHALARSERGGVLVDRHIVTVPEALADLPRVGVTFVLPASFTDLRWFGRGPHECYPDRQSSAMSATWEGGPDELPYLIPQEFGLRTDCRWFECRSPTLGLAVRVASLQPATLHCSAIHHTADDLERAHERLDLIHRDELHISIDVAHRGLGTASCGPDVLDRYRLGSGVFRFAYRIDVRPF